MTKQNAKKDGNSFFFQMGNQLSVLVLKGIALLPFACIYALSDFLYFLNATIFKYRYQVTHDNLKSAFPEKTEKEIAGIRDRFYRHFFDFSLESVKLYKMSADDMQSRLKIKGVDEFQRITNERNGSIILAFHYNNWEWSTFVQSALKHPVLMVYNPPRNNKPIEEFLKKSRGKWGGKVIRTAWAARYALRYKQNKKPATLWLAADQRALADSPFWTTFLNREAAFFSGPERIAAKTNHPIFFQHVKKIARGKYEVEFLLLVDEPAKIGANEILRSYVQKMEEVIKNKPEYYLWSHRRWKHTRPSDIPLIK